MLLWRNEIQIQDFLDAAVVLTQETIHQTSSKMTIMTMINFPRVQPGHQTVFLLTACMMIISTMMMHLFLLDLHESHLYRQDQLAVPVNLQDYLQHQASPEYQEMYMTDYPSLQQEHHQLRLRDPMWTFDFLRHVTATQSLCFNFLDDQQETPGGHQTVPEAGLALRVCL